MIKKVHLMFLFIFCCTLLSHAQEKKTGWELNLKKVGLNLSATEVKNAQDYQSVPNPQLTGDSQVIIQGLLNVNAARYGNLFLWNNELFAQYGKTRIRPSDGTAARNTINANIILLTSELNARLWSSSILGGFEAGPYGGISYQTEFSSQVGLPLKKLLRGNGGVKVFDGKYIKSLYAAGFAEEDFTYNPASEKFGCEAGLKLEYQVRDGVKILLSGLGRRYIHESKKYPSDLKYEAQGDLRMEVMMNNNLAIAPFIQYYTAQGKYIDSRGESTYIGVTLSFSKILVAADVK